jgi:hypothetical protein
MCVGAERLKFAGRQSAAIRVESRRQRSALGSLRVKVFDDEKRPQDRFSLGKFLSVAIW